MASQPTAAEWTLGVLDARIGIIGSDYTNAHNCQIAGWRNGIWALDFRVWEQPEDSEEYRSGWCLTHEPTGFMACGILAPLDEAKAIAAEFAECGDWSFDDPADAKRLSTAIRPIRDKHEGKLVFHTPNFSPFSFAKEPA